MEKIHIHLQKTGTFTFEFINEIGNRGTATATVDWIDKKVPNGIISYNIIEATNQPVVATISFDKENVTVTNNDGNNTYTFTDNKEFTFEFEDDAGNKGTAKAKVDWIDKTLPVAKITYNTTEPTNQDVVATIEFDKEDVIVEGGNTHTFTENGEYEFRFVGPAGNSGVAKAVVTWIDKVAPEALLVYSTILPTNENVTATVVFENEKEGEVVITNNNGKNSYVFEENGTFTFEFKDRAGNRGSVEAIVNCIDKIAPTATVSYDVTELTNGKVVATLENESEEITVINNDRKNTYTFTENGTFTFEFEDKAGNRGTATAKVTWIDKTLPVARITYSTTKLTNQDVVATIAFDKANVTVEDGNTHTFTENGEYTFEYVDEAGNTGMATATVTWIDKTAPTATIEYNITSKTNRDVIAKLIPNEEVKVLNNSKNVTDNEQSKGLIANAKTIEDGTNANQDTFIYTFTENGTFTFEFEDKAGNRGTATATVTWIDKVVPTAVLTYSTTSPTEGPVIVTVELSKEDAYITNNNGSNTYTFTENGSFKFDFMDEAGNSNSITATVNWIQKDEENIFELKEYNIQDKYILGVKAGIRTLKKEGTTVEKFKENVETNQILTFINKDGKVLSNEDVVGTGTILKIGDSLEYTIIVSGDVDGNGMISVNDLAKMKLHYIKSKPIEGNEFKAADVDGNGKITTNDLAKMKLTLIGKLELN